VNAFRKQNGKEPLAWEESLYKISTEHSNDMASGKVPFGHQGFTQRVASIPFKHGEVAENVAMNQGSDPAKTAVNQWINSAGHRANMLGNTNTAAIGSAQSRDGKWFFTQFFAQKK